MMQRLSNPRHTDWPGPVDERLPDIAVLKCHLATECANGVVRQIKRGPGKINPIIVRYKRSLERPDRRARVAAGDVEEPKRLRGLSDQNAAQLPVNFTVEHVVVFDDLSVGPPLSLE